MAMNPYQGDDIDPFSGARDKTGATNTRPTFQASTADQMDERDRREMEMTKESKGMLKPAAPTSFKEAFRAARNAGDKTFMFKGKKYNTDMASDKKAAPAAAPEKKEKKGSEILAEKQEKAAPKMAKSYRDMSLTQGLKDVAGAFGMKKGGKIAGYKKGGKIDGCAMRGKTKGRMI